MHFNKVGNMNKDLLTWFEEKFQEQLKHTPSRQDAFDKTINNIGFEPYSSYSSFSTVRSRKYKKRRPKK